MCGLVNQWSIGHSQILRLAGLYISYSVKKKKTRDQVISLINIGGVVK